MSAPEPYKGNAHFDDWLRRLLSHLRLEDPRYRPTRMHYMEQTNAPVNREQMVDFYGHQQNIADPLKRVDFLSSVLFDVLRQIQADGPAYTDKNHIGRQQRRVYVYARG